MCGGNIGPTGRQITPSLHWPDLSCTHYLFVIGFITRVITKPRSGPKFQVLVEWGQGLQRQTVYKRISASPFWPPIHEQTASIRHGDQSEQCRNATFRFSDPTDFPGADSEGLGTIAVRRLCHKAVPFPQFQILLLCNIFSGPALGLGSLCM